MITGGGYAITSYGSLGTVVQAVDSLDRVMVKFTYIESGEYGQHDYGLSPDHYWIKTRNCILEKNTNSQQAVLDKIKEMEARRVKGKVLKKKQPFGPPITTSYTW